MSIDPAWQRIHAERSWGTCPEPAMARWAIRHFGDRRPRCNTLLLDIGCGSGAQTRWLDGAGFSVHGVDGCEAAVVWAQNGMHTGVVRKMDVCDLHGYPDAMFDGAVDVCTLQHVEDIGKAMSEVARVLKPGGRLFSMMAADTMSDEAIAGVGFERRLSVTEVAGLLHAELWRETNIGRMTTMHPDTSAIISHWLIDAVRA